MGVIVKKYRIKKVNHTILGTVYYPQRRVFLFFWENVYPSKSLFVGYYSTYDGALDDIKERVENEKATRKLKQLKKDLASLNDADKKLLGL